MSKRRFVLADFTRMSREGGLRLFEAGRVYVLPRAAAQQPARWEAPG